MSASGIRQWRIGDQDADGGGRRDLPTPRPYGQLGDTWTRLMGEWLPASGHRVKADSPSYEVYRNTSMTVPKNELRTEIRIPVVS